MTIISVKRYGRYYNVDCDKGESAKNAIERAVALKQLGRSFSGPVEAKKHLPKVKKEVLVEKEKVEKPKAEQPKVEKPKIKAKKRTKDADTQRKSKRKK